MAPRILVPFDDSDSADDALEHAFGLFPDGEFVVLTVVDTTSLPFIPNAAEESEGSDERQDLLDEAAERLRRAESIADDHGVEIETRAQVGTPAQEVLEYAESQPVDHIVIGSHGRSGVARILLGSVAEVVVRHSPVPVTVVR